MPSVNTMAAETAPAVTCSNLSTAVARLGQGKGSKAVMHILFCYRWSRIVQPNSLWLLSALGLALLLCIPLVFASAQKTPPVAAKQRAAAPPSWSVCDSSSAGIKVTDASGLVYTCSESGDSETKSETKKDKPAASTSATIALEPAN